MPRYYFHIHDHQGVIPDDEGIDLPDLEAAKSEAKSSANELLAGVIRAEGTVDDRWIEVTDRDAVPVAIVKLRDLIH